MTSMDAISFVLGIKSSHLRSSHLRDLVYRGRVLQTSKIQADGGAEEGETNGATNGNTQGEQEDEDEDMDTQNSSQREPGTAWVMAVYEDDAGEEQAWRRSITASGTSEYRINNRVVTAKEYNDALETEQILIKARNFLVFQGDVEAIASQSAKDLTRLIEQICGSLDYKAEYDRLKIEQEKLSDIHQTKLQQRRSINSEVKQYQEQKREADNYAKKQRELDQAIVTHVLWKLHNFQRTIESSTEEIQKHQDELKEHRRNVASYENRLEKAKREQASAQKEVTQTEKRIKHKEKDAEDKENSLLPITEKIEISTKRIETSQKRINDVSKERDSQSKAVEKLQKDLSSVQRAQTQWEQQWQQQQQQTGRQLSAADLQEYGRLRTEVSKQTAAAQIQVDDITRQLRTDEETVNSLRTRVESNQNQVTKLDTEIGELRTRRSDIDTAVKANTRDIDAKKKALNLMTSERVRTAQKHRELEEKLQDVLRRIGEARDSKNENERDARAREMVSQLKRLFPGVRGQLWTLVKPKQKKYTTAVSTVLGRNHDSIVVDTTKTATDCLDYLKAQSIGIATFIPLDTIAHKAPDANLKGMHSKMRLAVDTIEYDHAIERAVSYACGSSIVCDDLDTARELCYNRRVDAKAVTLDGTVISKGGNMTGGQGPDQRNARKWDDAEVESLYKLKDNFISSLEGLPSAHQRKDEEDAVQGELSGLENRRKFAEDELKALDRNIESKRKELQFAKTQLAEAEPKLREQSQGVDNLEAELERHRTVVSTAEDKIFAGFCQRLQYPDIRAYEAQQGTLQQEASQKKLEFTTQRSRLENQLAFETQRLQATNERITRLENDVNAAQQNIDSLESERESLNDELDTLRGELDALKEQLQEQKTKVNERAEHVASERREVAKRSKSIEATTKAVEALEEEISTANMGRYNLLKRCRMEKISVPLNEGSRRLDSLPQGEQAEPDVMDIDEDESNPQIPAANDYGIDIDFDDLDDDLREDDSEATETALTSSIEKLQKALETMAPHARAAERLDSTEARMRDYDAQYQEAHRAMSAAKAAYEEVREQRSSLFTRAYEHISERIDSVYKELTRMGNYAMAGSASLTLEDDDEPYLAGVKYHAMPPLKRFRDMEHLSGGEKTMAALALLFAIHTYAPSPFFVLDEVDAALDNANTTRLAEYVKHHARPGMQFVVISLKVTFCFLFVLILRRRLADLFLHTDGFLPEFRDAGRCHARPADE